MPRVWLISGANTGIGLEIALKALKEGDQVIAAVRSPEKIPDSIKGPSMSPVQFDLSWSQEAIHEFMTKAVSVFGRIDVLVNNAGYAYMGAIEEVSDEAVKRQYDINVFGILRTIRATLPHFRQQKSGLIMNFSSIGGFHGFAGNGIYCSTKFAIEGITEAIAQEVAPFGIEAVIVEPGYFRTNFLSAASAGQNLAPAIKAYENTPAGEARRAFAKYNLKQPGNPVLLADRTWEYAAKKGMFANRKQLLRLPLGSDTGAQMRAFIADLEETVREYKEVYESTDFKE
ncbi:uncharacterized protein Z518_00301 [Rhinocladiella mackenziei CBS 650.93]|uniref:Uncharacterized protein n=1 Tax=Rhinocladiella mackenziei CBS 650.93 TaxID=1442369 RepID=A0A0D2G3N7_9EURO|nr:uncharacterized protein Z518_00301 [Rhinocladiella mackenziei CBS 650.93]KIX09222.1 hypothetical protein Z518_00301 [Rhinocladiella mackenziei CBS 650.93]